MCIVCYTGFQVIDFDFLLAVNFDIMRVFSDLGAEYNLAIFA